MKLICSISGIQYACTGFGRIALQGKHPVFDLPLDKLRRLYKLWQYRQLSDEETRLLALALFNSSKLVRWNSPADTNYSTAIANQAMPLLLDFLDFLETCTDRFHAPDFFPAYCVDYDSSDMSNLVSWVQTWHSCIEEYFEERFKLREAAKLAEKRAAAEIAQRRITRHPSRYIKQLADWCAEAAAFPNTPVEIAPNKRIPCIDYWKHILECCGTRDKDFRIFTIREQDISELEWHIYENLDLSSTFAFTIIELLKATKADINFFNGSGITIESAKSTSEMHIEVLAKPMLTAAPVISSYATVREWADATALYKQQQAALESRQQSNSGE